MRSVDNSTWAWVQEVYSLGFRFSFVERRSAGEMIAACGVDPAVARMQTLGEAFDEYEGDPIFRTGETEGWGFLVEEFGGQHDSLLREISAGRRAVSVTWVEPKAITSFDLYENGEQVCSFEPNAPYEHGRPAVAPFLPTMRRVGLVPDAGQDTDWVSPVVATLDMVTLEFGIRLGEEQVVGPLLTGEVDIDMSWLDG